MTETLLTFLYFEKLTAVLFLQYVVRKYSGMVKRNIFHASTNHFTFFIFLFSIQDIFALTLSVIAIIVSLFNRRNAET